MLDCRGIVENAILLGAPVSANSDDWAVLTKVVVGRLVNGYSRYVTSHLQSIYSY